MTGYCKWCDTLTNSIVKVYELGKLMWSGCPDCHQERKENDELKMWENHDQNERDFVESLEGDKKQ